MSRALTACPIKIFNDFLIKVCRRYARAWCLCQTVQRAGDLY